MNNNYLLATGDIVFLCRLQKHSKSYLNPDEDHRRNMIWKENKHFIDQHNQQADILGFTLEMNKFGDLVGWQTQN